MELVDVQTTVGQPEDFSENIDFKISIDPESNLPTAVKRTSVKSSKSITRHFDSDGNMIEEIVGEENPLIENEFWEKPSVDIQGGQQVTSSSTRLTTIKRTVDELGNIIDEEVGTVESADPHSQVRILEEIQSNKSNLKNEIQKTMDVKENGKLIFTLHGARDLEDKDWVGKSDPYAVVTLGQTVFKTQTFPNNLNPDFEQKMEFEINKTSLGSLNIEIFDEDITRDGCLGNTTIEISTIKMDKKIVNQSRNLSNSKTGKIIYSMHFISEVSDVFSDKDVEGSHKEVRKLKSVKTVDNRNEDKGDLVSRMSALGVENIELIPDDSTKSEDVLLKDVIDLQASTKKKISGLMKTIQKVELDTAVGNPQVYSRKIIKKMDSEGNVVEEIIEGDGASNMQIGFENDINSSGTSRSIVRKTVKILDDQGNIIEEKEIETTGDELDLEMLRNTTVKSHISKVLMDHQGNILDPNIDNFNIDDPFVHMHSLKGASNVLPEGTDTTYIIRKEYSNDSEKSPTIEDITYSEYPHLTTPMSPSLDILSSNFTTKSHSVRYFHSSSEPFQNITSLRAHFVQAFDEDVPDAKSTEYDSGVKDVKFDDTFSNYSESSSFNINRSVSQSTQLFSSTHSFSGSEFSSNKSTCAENTEKVFNIENSSMYMLASEEPSLEELVSETSVTTWMKPVISGNCLSDKEFWKNQTNTPSTAFFSCSSHSTTPEHGLASGPQSLRSPISVLKDNSPVLFQSLPSSPKKKNSVKRVITSELFSSDKDISRSLELVYTEPNDDPKEKLSTIYKSVAPLKQNLVERKPSFTKIKRPSIEYDIHSGSSSPEWRIIDGKSVDFSPCYSSNEYSFQTKSISIPQKSSHECQISTDICPKDPPCVQLFNPQSQSSVRSPERKFQYVQGLDEQYSANVEERVETIQKEDMVTNLTQTGSKEPAIDLDIAISKEHSFVYDTSVEAFGTKGEIIDGGSGNDKMLEEQCLTGDSSLFGQTAGLEESKRSIDEIEDFIESNTPSKESQVEKFEYFENKANNLHEEDISTSQIERPETDNSEIVIEDKNEDFKIPLSSSPLKVETLFLTESTESQTNTPRNDSEGIMIPKKDIQNRRLSNISVEDENKISSTPEGENYFMKREQSFISKVEKREVEHLAVEISDYYNLVQASDENLRVKPIESTPETEIEIRDLPVHSNLTVKPVEQVVRRIPVSSYEQIYDTVSIEDIAGHSQMSAAEIMSSLGDRFQGTHEVPEFVSSFEDLYQRSTEGTTDDLVISALKATTELPGERWSAPAGAIEPPILEANEFSSRITPLQNKIENHWEEIEILMSTETLVGQEQESSKKPSSNN